MCSRILGACARHRATILERLAERFQYMKRAQSTEQTIKRQESNNHSYAALTDQIVQGFSAWRMHKKTVTMSHLACAAARKRERTQLGAGFIFGVEAHFTLLLHTPSQSVCRIAAGSPGYIQFGGPTAMASQGAASDDRSQPSSAPFQAISAFSALMIMTAVRPSGACQRVREPTRPMTLSRISVGSRRVSVSLRYVDPRPLNCIIVFVDY
jgi:hypothetical protein